MSDNVDEFALTIAAETITQNVMFSLDLAKGLIELNPEMATVAAVMVMSQDEELVGRSVAVYFVAYAQATGQSLEKDDLATVRVHGADVAELKDRVFDRATNRLKELLSKES